MAASRTPHVTDQSPVLAQRTMHSFPRGSAFPTRMAQHLCISEFSKSALNTVSIRSKRACSSHVPSLRLHVCTFLCKVWWSISAMEALLRIVAERNPKPGIVDEGVGGRPVSSRALIFASKRFRRILRTRLSSGARLVTSHWASKHGCLSSEAVAATLTFCNSLLYFQQPNPEQCSGFGSVWPILNQTLNIPQNLVLFRQQGRFYVFLATASPQGSCKNALQQVLIPQKQLQRVQFRTTQSIRPLRLRNTST